MFHLGAAVTAIHSLVSVRLDRVAASASTVRYAVRHYTPEEPAKRLMNVQGREPIPIPRMSPGRQSALKEFNSQCLRNIRLRR
jgi:hypothetical protein